MLKIDKNKIKSFSVSMVTEGIDTSKLKFNFSIKIDESIISFPAELKGDNLKVIIPPLSNKLKDIKPGKYDAWLEAYSMDENKKGYYLRPWYNSIEISQEPRMIVDITEEKENDKSGIKINKIDEIEIEDEDILETVEEPKIKSKFGEILDEK